MKNRAGEGDRRTARKLSGILLLFKLDGGSISNAGRLRVERYHTAHYAGETAAGSKFSNDPVRAGTGKRGNQPDSPAALRKRVRIFWRRRRRQTAACSREQVWVGSPAGLRAGRCSGLKNGSKFLWSPWILLGRFAFSSVALAAVAALRRTTTRAIPGNARRLDDTFRNRQAGCSHSASTHLPPPKISRTLQPTGQRSQSAAPRLNPRSTDNLAGDGCDGRMDSVVHCLT